MLYFCFLIFTQRILLLLLILSLFGFVRFVKRSVCLSLDEKKRKTSLFPFADTNMILIWMPSRFASIHIQTLPKLVSVLICKHHACIFLLILYSKGIFNSHCASGCGKQSLITILISGHQDIRSSKSEIHHNKYCTKILTKC